jgi:hypothetical protein
MLFTGGSCLRLGCWCSLVRCCSTLCVIFPLFCIIAGSCLCYCGGFVRDCSGLSFLCC